MEVPKEPHLYDNAGWNRNAKHIMDYFLYKEVPRLLPEARARIVDKALAKMDELDEMRTWYFKKEVEPLTYMPYISDVVERMSRYRLTDILSYTRWIRAGSYYHLQIVKQEKLNARSQSPVLLSTTHSPV